MILIQTDRNLFLNEDLVYGLPGKYVEVGQQRLMAICTQRFQGPRAQSNLPQRKYYHIQGYNDMLKYVIMLLFSLAMASHMSE